MTPERAKMLEAVAVAARVWSDTPLSHNINEEQALVKALTALDALPAEPADAGEMVEVRAKVWRDPHGDTLNVTNEHAKMEQWWVPHCIITARIPRPVVPEVRAEVIQCAK